MPALCLIGPGRAGQAVSAGLVAAGWELAATLGRGDDVGGAAGGVDLVLVATPDAAVPVVAGEVAGSGRDDAATAGVAVICRRASTSSTAATTQTATHAQYSAVIPVRRPPTNNPRPSSTSSPAAKITLRP